ncbi:MAG: tRNA (adenosine(37)-N6)-threonylcarbamoyltransferase complex ATPase subunit type 1 TsaE [Pseudomonadota bacterium]
MLQVELPDLESTERLGAAIARVLPDDPAGWTLLLSGELGAGKSSLARALLRARGHAGPVPSPSYALIEPYEVSGTAVYHIDLYRLGGEEELRYLGFDELDDGLKLVEWPDRAPRLTDTADLDLRLEYAGDARRALLSALSERGQALLESLEIRLGEAKG